MKDSDISLQHEIITSLGSCGHFLHYRMGGNYGRRRIFSVLLEKGEILQCNLQNELGISSGAMSEILAKIENDDFIEKSRSDTDGRQIVLRLTDAGKTEAIRMQNEYEEKMSFMLSCFNAEQKKSLLEMLRILLTHWCTLENDRRFNAALYAHKSYGIKE
ncbi:MAG TPA: MarR family winged helix-turn-helix transcriptional regulator [Firmicutes bacterium]|nr:MarR family winged helix-turn-helix transcriptional regulator [Bacillota bacterium]